MASSRRAGTGSTAPRQLQGQQQAWHAVITAARAGHPHGKEQARRRTGRQAGRRLRTFAQRCRGLWRRRPRGHDVGSGTRVHHLRAKCTHVGRQSVADGCGNPRTQVRAALCADPLAAAGVKCGCVPAWPCSPAAGIEQRGSCSLPLPCDAPAASHTGRFRYVHLQTAELGVAFGVNLMSGSRRVHRLLAHKGQCFTQFLSQSP